MVMSARTKSLFQQFSSRGLLETPDISILPEGRHPKAPNTGAQDFASYMLTHTSGDRGAAKLFSKSVASRTSEEHERASVLSTLFDTLSVPLYGASAIVTGQADNALELAERFGIGHGAVFG